MIYDTLTREKTVRIMLMFVIAVIHIVLYNYRCKGLLILMSFKTAVFSLIHFDTLNF